MSQDMDNTFPFAAEGGKCLGRKPVWSTLAGSQRNLPWKEAGVSGKREELVLLAGKEGSPMSAWRRRLGGQQQDGLQVAQAL
jgi:hypothetical protein